MQGPKHTGFGSRDISRAFQRLQFFFMLSPDWRNGFVMCRGRQKFETTLQIQLDWKTTTNNSNNKKTDKTRALTGPPDFIWSSMKDFIELSSSCTGFGSVVKATGLGIVRQWVGGAGVCFCKNTTKIPRWLLDLYLLSLGWIAWLELFKIIIVINFSCELHKI